jgi:hypothetical protein
LELAYGEDIVAFSAEGTDCGQKPQLSFARERIWRD